MLKKILSLFILLSFCFVIEAAHDIPKTDVSHLDNIDSALSTVVMVAVNHKDCEGNNDCHDEEDHCMHHCNGLHNISSISYKIILIKPSNFEGKTLWYFSNHYKMPNLEPSLKPPLFS